MNHHPDSSFPRYASTSLRSLAFTLLLAISAASVTAAETRWWKGNLHTHSLWSDGDDYPEMVVGWYKDHGYNFLTLSDHNRMLVGERWVILKTSGGGGVALDKYIARFGTNWVEIRGAEAQRSVRLKTLEEFRNRFEAPEGFLLIAGEEISDYFNQLPIHLNATNLRELIPPQGGKSAYEVMQNNVNAVLDQQKKTGQPMIPHINHPNFRWALTAEDIARLRGERFLEIYNGHPITWNYGDTNHASMERIWDIVLTKRLAELAMEPIWGTAVDDAHSYHQYKVGNSNPGRGWLMVRSAQLTPANLIAALEKGDFYASSGVRLKEIRRTRDELCVEIEPEVGVSYTTQFIGTRKGYDPTSEPVMEDGKPLPTTRRYSKDIGTILAEAKGLTPCYKLKGDEIYVRAKIISSKPKKNPMEPKDVETAWVQPVVR